MEEGGWHFCLLFQVLSLEMELQWPSTCQSFMSNRHASLEELLLLRREVFFTGLSVLARSRAQICLNLSSDSLTWPRFLSHGFQHLTASSQTVNDSSSLPLPPGSCWLPGVGQVSLFPPMLAAWRLDRPSMSHGVSIYWLVTLVNLRRQL